MKRGSLAEPLPTARMPPKPCFGQLRLVQHRDPEAETLAQVDGLLRQPGRGHVLAGAVDQVAGEGHAAGDDLPGQPRRLRVCRSFARATTVADFTAKVCSSLRPVR